MINFEGRRIIIVLGLVIAFLASGCGTLTIETEPEPNAGEAQGDTAANDSTLSEIDAVAPASTVVIEEADELDTEVAISEVSEAIGEVTSVPLTELQEYTNAEYGFSLSFPSSWSLAEVNDADFVGPGSRSVQLSQGTVMLSIGYRRIGEQAPLGGSGVPAGEFEVRGTTRFLGRDMEQFVIVYEGKDKVVMYGEPGSGALTLGGLEFSARLNDFNPDYDSIELSQTIQDEASMILSSLTVIETEGASDSGTTSDNYQDWQRYTNEQVGYSLMVPGTAEVMALDPNDRVAFIGPEVDGKPQFQFMVVHYDLDATEADNFMQDLAEGHRAFLESMGKPAEGQVEEMVIAGEPAIKLSFPAINGSDPRDDYFFVHDGTMFTLSITHFNGVEDKSLNDLFLQSITLEQSQP